MKRTARLGFSILVLFTLLSCGPDVGQKPEVPGNQQTAFIYVDVNTGSDANSGTATSPVKTIGYAAKLAAANNEGGVGSTVLIQPGTYREAIGLYHTGRETDAPITFQASGSQNGPVIISGSEVWVDWAPYVANNNIFTHPWPYAWGLCSVPSAWPAVSDIVRRREMIFVNGNLLRQVLSLSQLVVGSFFVDETGGVVYIWPPWETDISTAIIEVATRPMLLQIDGKTNLTLTGLTFQNGNSCIGDAAVILSNSVNLLVENCRFLWNNWSGLMYYYVSNPTIQGIVADNNGGAGVEGSQIKNILYENNETSHNTWRGAWGGFYTWAMAGGKFSRVHVGRFKGLSATANQSRGLWFDTDNANITIDTAYLTQNRLDGIFVEANQGPLSITNCRVCYNSDNGVVISNSQDVTLTGNTVYNNGQSQIFLGGASGGVSVTDWETGAAYDLFGQRLTISQNTIVGSSPSQLLFGTLMAGNDWNIFVSTLESDKNTWYNGYNNSAFQLGGGTMVDFSGWRLATGRDLNSQFGPPSTDPATACQIP